MPKWIVQYKDAEATVVEAQYIETDGNTIWFNNSDGDTVAIVPTHNILIIRRHLESP